MFLFLIVVVFNTFSSLQAACGLRQSEVKISITPDDYPGEISWSLRDNFTNALIDSGRAVGDTICIPSNQCVVFSIFDSQGDGICCAYGIGSYSVSLNNTIVAYGGNYGSKETTVFNCAAGVACTNPSIAREQTMTALFPDAWYTFVPDTSGIYVISTCSLNNTCDTKLYVYDACAGIKIDENNPGTIFYNDDACANEQSEIVADLIAGKTYYIRVGDFATSCANKRITWKISYSGPIKGCMDSTSCNYNPLATIDTGGCVYGPSPLCPAPDLEVVQSELEATMAIDNLTVTANNCYIGEGCLTGYGTRRLIRFSTHIKNIGNQDYFIGSPDASPDQFVYDECHGHYHYKGYAEYILYNQNYQPLQSGFKNGFCVLDLECDGGGSAKYGCGNMGISAGCGDIYSSDLDCQWIDITDIDTGKYTFVIRVNWDRSPDKLGHHESRYDNNQAMVCLHIYLDNTGKKIFDILPDCAAFRDCAGDIFGSALLDCSNICNGSSVLGDVNSNHAADSLDVTSYLNGLKEDALTYRSCIDLNGDDFITVTDAVRLNGCLLQNTGIHTHTGNYQNTHKHCEFPFNIYNPFDSSIFSIANVNWNQKYIDLNVLNPSALLLAYEFKMHGLVIDSVVNTINGIYKPDIRWSNTGHIVCASLNENSLFRQTIPKNFLRIYYRNLTDTIIYIDTIIAVVNSNYEEIKGKIGGTFFKEPHDTLIITGLSHAISSELVMVPNPTTGLFTINFSDFSSMQNIPIFITDVLGKKIQPTFYYESNNRATINLSGHAAGIYILQIIKGNKNFSKQIILVDK